MSAPTVSVHDVSKTFGSLRALDGVSIELHAGTIHAVVGENGAGKTTLVRIIAGMLEPDAGTIQLDGSTVGLRSRSDGIDAGIGLVQQHLTLIGELSAAENFLLRPGINRCRLDRSAASDALVATAAELGFDLEPELLVQEMSFGDRQRLEVVMAIAHECRVLMLDEPTSLLGTSDAEAFLEALRRTRDRGTTIVFVSHKLAEVVALADVATVLRAGRAVARFGTGSLTEASLATAMVGERPAAASHPSGSSAPTTPDHALVLSAVSTVATRSEPGLAQVDLSVGRGEIVGIAGLSGSGQEALAGVIAGVRQPASGSVTRPPGGSAYIPEQRHRDAVAPAMSVVDNVIVHAHRSLTKRGLLSAGAASDMASTATAEYRLPVGALDRPLATLSGGNQQRVVLARELHGEPGLVVANNPYVGLDIALTSEVRERLQHAAARGAAVVIISPELEDLFDVCDRVDVMFAGKIVGTVSADGASGEEIGKLLGGVTATG